MEPDPVLPPVLGANDQLEFLSEQRVVRVRYPERSALNVVKRRS